MSPPLCQLLWPWPVSPRKGRPYRRIRAGRGIKILIGDLTGVGGSSGSKRSQRELRKSSSTRQRRKPRCFLPLAGFLLVIITLPLRQQERCLVENARSSRASPSPTTECSMGGCAYAEALLPLLTILAMQSCCCCCLDRRPMRCCQPRLLMQN